jgi:hypothetical protein
VFLRGPSEESRISGQIGRMGLVNSHMGHSVSGLGAGTGSPTQLLFFAYKNRKSKKIRAASENQLVYFKWNGTPHVIMGPSASGRDCTAPNVCDISDVRMLSARLPFVEYE